MQQAYNPVAPLPATPEGWTGARQGEVAIPTRSWWSLRSQTIAMLGLLTLLIMLNAVVVIKTQGEVAAAHAQALTAAQSAGTLLRLDASVRRQDEALLSYFAYRDSVYATDFAAARAEVDLALQQLRAAPLTEERKQDLIRVTAEVSSWEAWAEKRRQAALRPNPGAADQQDAQTGEYLQESFGRYALLFEKHLRADAAAADATAHAQQATQTRTVQLTALGSLALVVLLSSLFLRNTLLPITRLVAAAIDLASGRRVAVPYSQRRDEVGQLAKALEAWNRSAQERLALARSMNQVGDQESLEEVLRLGAQFIQEELGAAQVLVILALNGQWQVAYASPAGYAAHLLLANSPEGEALRTQQPVAEDLRNVRWDPTLRSWQTVNDYGPVLSVPLVSGRQLLGVVSAVRRINQPPFSALDHELAEIVVPPIANAIHVALLVYDNRQQRWRRDHPTQLTPATPSPMLRPGQQ